MVLPIHLNFCHWYHKIILVQLKALNLFLFFKNHLVKTFCWRDTSTQATLDSMSNMFTTEWMWETASGRVSVSCAEYVSTGKWKVSLELLAALCSLYPLEIYVTIQFNIFKSCQCKFTIEYKIQMQWTDAKCRHLKYFVNKYMGSYTEMRKNKCLMLLDTLNLFLCLKIFWLFVH